MKIRYTIMLILLLTINSCSNPRGKGKKISTSIEPIRYFTEQIAGETWQVKSIIPSNANHGNYEPTPQDLRVISDSQIYFSSGDIGFEDAWTKRFEEIAKDCYFFDISQGIKKVGGHYHGDVYHGADPHYWLSPREAKIISKNILNVLCERDEANKLTYETNYNSLISKIEETDSIISEILKPVAGHSFMIYHPALTYFAQYYNLKQIAIEHEGKEPSAAHIAELIDTAKKENIGIILYQEQYTGNSVKHIANEVNARQICFDPMNYDWHNNLIHIAQTLRQNK